MWREQHCPSFKNDSNRTQVLVHSIRQTYNVCVPVCAHVHSHMHACPCEYVCSAGHVICISSLCIHYRQDPLVNLNYTVFLYNRGERKLAAKQFSMFEQKHKAQGQVEIDSEVSMAHILSNCVRSDQHANVNYMQLVTCLGHNFRVKFIAIKIHRVESRNIWHHVNTVMQDLSNVFVCG